MRHALLLAVTFAACGDDGSPAPIDSPAAIDSPMTIDSPMGNVCIGQIYDRCTSNTQCMSGNCRMFNNLGVMLCTQACTPGGAACPMQGATVVNCSTGGGSNVCRPAAANACTPP
ncbi:MAG: hypothetical protein ABL962_02530 [Fimbriimonadaceae bacterium]